ncbi:uncharacterized protein [Anabrus simplex]|uniref:uncharacterized protein n=1 Tax=Anabrus simplex TaxID=316456 RepID=UPI0035A3680B
MCEMDQKVEIKEEPVWLEEKASTSFPSVDVKDELIIEEHTVDQHVSCFKEEQKHQLLCEMDQKIEIKEEPVWLEGTASTSFDNYVLTLDEVHLKEETKSELPEPGQTQDNYELASEEMHFKEETKSDLAEPEQTQPATDIKDEICVVDHTVGQLVACLKKEDSSSIFGHVVE